MIQNDKTHIAVLEDDQDLRNDLIEYLQLRGYIVKGFESTESLFSVNPTQIFDLAIIDIGLPGINGLHAAHWLRSRSSIGIVILTALGNQSEQILGLETVADSYLIKNTSLEIIEATCRSVLRRIKSRQDIDHIKSAQDLFVRKHVWQLSPRAWTLTTPTGIKVELTHAETQFLQCLMQQIGTPVNRTDLLISIGRSNTINQQRNLDNCSSRLRRKVEKESGLEIPIRPCYGSGYTFTGEGEIEGA